MRFWSKTQRSLATDSVGAISVEYLVVVGAVSIGLAAAVAALGPLLVADYTVTRAIMASPEVD